DPAGVEAPRGDGSEVRAAVHQRRATEVEVEQARAGRAADDLVWGPGGREPGRVRVAVVPGAVGHALRARRGLVLRRDRIPVSVRGRDVVHVVDGERVALQ